MYIDNTIRQWYKDNYSCLIRKESGVLCGYVGVPYEHPLYNIDLIGCWKGCDDISCDKHGKISSILSAHKEITWAEYLNDIYDGYWYIGFHCGHTGDFIPNDSNNTPGASYRDEKYVTEEVEKLWKQLKRIEEGGLEK